MDKTGPKPRAACREISMSGSQVHQVDLIPSWETGWAKTCGEELKDPRVLSTLSADKPLVVANQPRHHFSAPIPVLQ